MDNITKNEKSLFKQYTKQSFSGKKLDTVIYDYVDQYGRLVFQVVREQYENGKTFYQRRPDGKGGWINDLKGVRTVPYRLPEVIKAVSQGKTVFIVEGEKDVETLRSLQLTATTNPMGAGKWKTTYSKYFEDANVVIIPDNDEVGKKHAEAVAEKLLKKAKSIKIVELPDLEEHGDVTDWLENGGTKEQLLQLVKQTPFYADIRKEKLVPGDDYNNDTHALAIRACQLMDERTKGQKFFWKSGTLEHGIGRVLITNDDHFGFSIMSEKAIYCEVDKVAKGSKKGQGPAKKIATAIYEMSPDEVPFKTLKRIVRIPIFSSDGKLIIEPGYYSKDQILYIPRKNYRITVPQNPTKEEIQEAKAVLEDDVLVDFQFVSKADKTHAIAYLLLFLVREMIDGFTPLHIFEAAKQGTGKTMLAETIMKVLTQDNYRLLSNPGEEELRKKITSDSIRGIAGFCLDNLTVLQSPLLAQVLQSQQYSDRLLGTNTMVETEIKWVWAATGNNMKVDADIARRSIRIRFTCDMAKPQQRTRENFKHPNFRRWCIKNATKIIQSGLTLVQAWIAADQPLDSKANLGGFEEWAEIMGGMLSFLGYEDFLGNTDEFYDEAEKGAEAWNAMLAKWWETFGDKIVTTGEILPIVEATEGIYLGKDDRETSKKNYLSRFLSSKRDTVTDVVFPDRIVPLKLVKAARVAEGSRWSLHLAQPKLKIYLHNKNEENFKVRDKDEDNPKKTEPAEHKNEIFRQAENAITDGVLTDPSELASVDSVENVVNIAPSKNAEKIKKVKIKKRRKKDRAENATFSTLRAPDPHFPLTATGLSEVVVSGENCALSCSRPFGEIKRCISDREIALDLETVGTSPHKGRLCVLSVACGDDYWIVQNPPEELLRTVVSCPKKIIGHNLAFDIAFLFKALGRRLKLNVFDTWLAARLIECGRRDENGHRLGFALEEVAERYLGITMDKTLQTCDWSKPLTEHHIEYCINDVQVPLKLYEMQKELLEKNKLTAAADLEFGCVPATAEMVFNGFRFDMEGAQRLLDSLVLPDNMDPNPFSAKRILEYFAEQGITLSDTQEATLKLLGHPVANQILQYREIKKGRDLLETCLEHAAEHDGRIHPKLFQLGAETGRYTCSDPNLQQVPGKEEFRKLFIPSDGHLLISGDWSAIELRIMASLSGDPTMLKAFAEGQDLHRITASKISGKAPDQITKAERGMAKAVNFGLIYGMGEETLRLYARDSFGTDMSDEEAEKARQVFFKTYPYIKRYHAHIKNRPDQTYYLPEKSKIVEKTLKLVHSRSGRVRIVGLDENGNIYFTQAVNQPDQGTGADMLKKALTLLYRDTDYRLILPVHDEIVIEVPEEEAEHAKEVLHDIMVRAGREFIDPVPVEAEVKVGRSWGECH